MSTKVCVVYHSGFGHTARQAEAVHTGAGAVDGCEAVLLSVDDLTDENASGWAELDAADAMIFGSPTYMGSASAAMRRFMEMSSGRWMEGRWADKLAAGFTNSGSQNGDKHNTLVAMVTFAAQHGMLWVSLGVPPGNNHSGGSVDDLNRLGGSIGALAQSNVDVGPDRAPPKADLDTARALGERVARSAQRWA